MAIKTILLPAVASICGILALAAVASASTQSEASPESDPVWHSYDDHTGNIIQNPLRFGSDMRRQTWSEYTCRTEGYIPCVDRIDGESGADPSDGTCCRSRDDTCSGVSAYGTCTKQKDCTANGNPNTLSLFVLVKPKSWDLPSEKGEHMCCLKSKLPTKSAEKGACCVWPLGFGRCVQPGDSFESEGCCPFCPDGEVLCYSSPTEASCMKKCGSGTCHDRSKFTRSNVDGTYILKPGACRVSDRDLPRFMGPLEPAVVFFFIINLIVALKGIQEAILEGKEVRARLGRKDPLWTILAFDYAKNVEKMEALVASDDPTRGLEKYDYLRKDLHGETSFHLVFSGVWAIIFDILRLYEWSFLFCQTGNCRKTASAFIFASMDLLCQLMAFNLNGSLNAAVMYSSSSKSDLGLKATTDLLGSFNNIAWVLYESYSARDEVTGTGTLFMWILSPIIIVLAEAYMFWAKCISRNNGLHSLLDGLKQDRENKFTDGGPAAFQVRAKMQERQKRDFGAVQDMCKLEDSEILRKANYKTYIDSGNCKELFERIRGMTSRSGNLNDEDGNPVFDEEPDFWERVDMWLGKAKEKADFLQGKVNEFRRKSDNSRSGGGLPSQLYSQQSVSRGTGMHSVNSRSIPSSVGYPGQNPGANHPTGGFSSGSPPMAGANSGPPVSGFSSASLGPFPSFGPQAQLGFQR